MRLRHHDGSVVHVAYGTNVHPAETVDGLVEQVRRFGGGVRAALDVDLLGLGLWLPAGAAAELASSPGQVARMRQTLAAHGLEVVTVNAFPFARFQAPVVKRAVYSPDWADRARLDYTLDCARVLAMLLPDDAARGSISTLPLGWRSPWYADRDRAAAAHLDELDEALAKLAAEIGRPVRVGLEPEPGCVVETTQDAVRRLGGTRREHVGVCVDTCHLATGFEDPHQALDELDRAGLPVVKAQPSAALHAEHPADDETRQALGGYAEDRFLHQVRELHGRRVVARDDLGEALDGDRPLPGRHPWRVHFHVPVHAPPAPPLSSTTDHLVRSLDALVGGAHARTDHLELETYTWGVLPADRRPADQDGLVTGLAGELGWLRDRLLALGLEAA
jgi:sugar phosphate isomerase/epimerase